MVANIRGYTPNYNFKLINFDTPRWHTLEYANWTQVDGMMLQMGTPPIRGEWLNSVLYLAGDRVFDAQTSEIYRAQVEHVSAATGLFEDDRDLHPDYWVLQTLGVPVYRGAWLPGVAYSLGDIAVVDGYSYYLCIDTHVSLPTFPEDAADWQLVYDGTATVDAAEAAQAAAELAADNAATSETNAANSAAAAANSETNAATSAAEAANSATASADSATSAAEDAQTATEAAAAADASAADAAAQAERLQGTSVTPNALGAGTKTFETQAGKLFDPGVFLTIVDKDNPNVNVMGTQSTAYVGTTLTVNVITAQGSGTYANWDIFVSGSVGRDGATGTPGTATIIVSDATPPAASNDNALWWDSNNGVLYIYYYDGNTRQWVQAAPQPDTTHFLLREGDTMTGHLGLPTGPAANNAVRKDYVDAAISSAVGSVDLSSKLDVAGGTITGGLQVNSNLNVLGQGDFGGNVNCSSLHARVDVWSSNTPTTGYYHYGTSGTKYSSYDGTNFSFIGGGLYVHHGNLYARDTISSNSNLEGRDIWSRRAGADHTGVIFLGNSGSRYLHYDGANYSMPGTSLYLGNELHAAGGLRFNGDAGCQSDSGNMIIGCNGGGGIYFRPYRFDNGTAQVVIDGAGSVNLSSGNFTPPNGNNGGFACKHADSNYVPGDYFNFANASGILVAYIGNVFMGAVAFYSDYRIKKDIQPLPSTWEAVKSLKPIKYTHKDFGETFKADDIERWGFIAHELQETLVESAATGVKDQDKCIQSPNPFTLIAALTKALQEAMERIEALEAKV